MKNEQIGLCKFIQLYIKLLQIQMIIYAQFASINLKKTFRSSLNYRQNLKNLYVIKKSRFERIELYAHYKKWIYSINVLINIDII